jgi:hypothetical protein
MSSPPRSLILTGDQDDETDEEGNGEARHRLVGSCQKLLISRMGCKLLATATNRSPTRVEAPKGADREIPPSAVAGRQLALRRPRTGRL